jgi:hypothetical protein
MTNLLFGYENWLSFYRTNPTLKKNIWIFVKLSNNQEIYLKDYAGWSEIKQMVVNQQIRIDQLGLRYRSHQIEVDTASSDGVYLVRSAKGEFGTRTKNCYTIGIVQDDKVHKTMWLTPELVQEGQFVDDIDVCFQEALIVYEK